MRKTLAMLAFAAGLGPAAAAGGGGWTPDDALIAKIEAALPPVLASSLTDPGNHPVPAAAPFDQYARYYAGETLKGERIVVGVLVIGFGGTPGAHATTMDHLPGGAGGGCGMIHIWYHVATGQIENVCNFPM